METNNITEDYVSFETAKLLNEKEFDWPTYMAYCETNREHQLSYDVGHTNSQWNKFNKEDGIFNCSAPTLQMAMKWLRKIHNIIPIILTGDNRHDGVIIYYWFRIDTIKNGRWKDAVYREDEIEYPTYEKACDAAIQYCLENLV